MGTLLGETGDRSMQNASYRTQEKTCETTRKPRVLHLVNSFEAGGTERQFVELLKRINRNRFDVRLAAIRKEGAFYQEIAPLFSEISEFRINSFYNRNAFNQLRRLRALIQKEAIDIIHTHGFYDSLFGTVAGRLSNITVIASQRHLKLSDRRVHEWGTRIIHRFANRIVVNSQAIRDSIIERNQACESKIIVIRNGLCELATPSNSNRKNQTPSHAEQLNNELARQQAHKALCRELGIHPQSKIFGMVARLYPVKGHKYFLEAAAQVAANAEQAHFVLVGDGELKNQLAQQAENLGIQNRLHLLGNRSDARHLVSAFDVAVLTSLSEGLPNTVMEAMSAGVPMVATAVGGTRELIRDGETGFLVPPADVNSLVERLRFILSNETLSKRIAENGREFVTSQFSISRMVEAVEHLYEELLTAGKPKAQ
ncbi:MAG: glycosyltransferase [Acidobacteriota bacterium]